MQLPSFRSIASIAKLGAAVFTMTAVSGFAGTSMLRAQIDWRFLFGTSTSSVGNTSFPAPSSSSSKPASSAKSSSKSVPPTGIQRCCMPSTGACMGLDFMGCANGVIMDAAYCATACPALRSSSSSSISSSRSSSSSSTASSIPQACCNYKVPKGSCTPVPANGCNDASQGLVLLNAVSCPKTCEFLAATMFPPSSRSMQSYPYPTSRSSSSSTSIASLPPSSSAVSSSSSSAVTCCTCYYQEHPKCAMRTAAACMPKDCSDGIDNDKDGKIDGTGPKPDSGCVVGFGFNDESELPGYQPSDCTLDPAGTCISRHLAICQNKTRPEFAACNQFRILPKGTVTPVPAEWKCSVHKPIEFGHEIPGQCTGVTERIEHTLNCTDPNCAVEFKNAGCGTAQDLDAWRTCIPRFQELMAARGIPMLAVEAEQSDHVIDKCTTTVRFEITQNSVNESYGPCLFGNACPTPGQKFTCTYQSSPLMTKNGICCRGPNGKVRMEDTFGGACPNFCRPGYACAKPGTTEACALYPDGKTASSQTCCPVFGGQLGYVDGTSCPGGRRAGDATSRVTVNGSCAEAQKQAIAVAQERIADDRQKCELTAGAKFTQSCSAQKHSSSYVPWSCTYDGDCDWECVW